MPTAVCVSFEVEEDILEHPVLEIYMPDGFRSVGEACGYMEANVTFFPECVGQMPLPASEISCQEAFDPRKLLYYLQFEASGVANSSEGFAFQFQVKAPRTTPVKNTWSLALESNTYKALCFLLVFSAVFV